LSAPIDTTVKKDTALIMLLLIVIPAIIYFGLQSALYFLGYNVLVLGVVSIFGLLFGRKYIYEKETAYGTLILISFFLRFFISQIQVIQASFYPTDSIALLFKNLSYGLQVVGLLAVIALAEESFRASIIALLQDLFSSKSKASEPTIQLLIVTIANILWLAFHFIQRTFVLNATMIYYIVWLVVTGYILSVILIKAGLGTAALAHFLINISA